MTTDPTQRGSGIGGIFTGPPSAAATPPIALPLGKLAASALVWAAGAAGVSVLIILLLRGFRPADLVVAVGGMAFGCLAAVGSVAMLRPWRPRPVAQWPFALLGAQAFSCMGALILAGVLYFAARPDPVPLTLSVCAAFIGAWVGQVRVFSAHVQAPPDSSPTPR